jgi:Rab GDP dissociation inhibitor
VVYDDAGNAVGVTSEGETAKAKLIIGDPTYFPQKVSGLLLWGACMRLLRA